GQRGGVGTHLGAALHARVAAYRHQARPVAPDVAAGQRHVHDRLDAVDRVAMLRDAHAPHEDRRLGAHVLVGEGVELAACDARVGEEVVDVHLVEGGDEIAPAPRVGVDERAVDGTAVDQPLEERVGERHVTSGSYGDVEVADLRAEDGRFQV